MAILKSSVRLIIREHASYAFSAPVLTLGVPEVYATYRELASWFPEFAGIPCRVAAEAASTTTNDIGKRLGWVSADTFFKAFGFTDVTSMDIPGCEHPPDVVHDLNVPFPGSLVNRFNLVVDPATLEHVFDIKTALTSIVHALRVGGVVIHQLPVYTFNGGYYSINPNVICDFYRCNGFSHLKAWLIMWDRYRPYTGRYRCYPYWEPLFGQRHALADYDQCRYTPCLLFMGRKVDGRSTITVPIQGGGDYLSTLEGGQRGAPPGFLRAGRRLVNRLLPLPVALYLGAAARRWWQLRETRRRCFWM